MYEVWAQSSQAHLCCRFQGCAETAMLDLMTGTYTGPALAAWGLALLTRTTHSKGSLVLHTSPLPTTATSPFTASLGVYTTLQPPEKTKPLADQPLYMLIPHKGNHCQQHVVSFFV